jgi:hypothetical protein
MMQQRVNGPRSMLVINFPPPLFFQFLKMGAEISKDQVSVDVDTKSKNGSSNPSYSHISRMDKTIRNRVKCGVKYNMKIAVCGCL